MKYAYMFSLSISVIGLTISCIDDRSQSIIEDFLIKLNQPLGHSTYFIDLSDACVGCQEYLARLMSHTPEDRYVIFSDKARENAIYFASIGRDDVLVLPRKEYRRIMELLRDKVIHYAGMKGEVKKIDKREFFSRQIRPVHWHSVDTIAPKLRFSFSMPQKTLNVDRIKRTGEDTYYLRAVIKTDDSDQTSAIFRYSAGELDRVVDLYTLGEHGKYPLGILDFIVEENRLFVISTMEIIAYDLRTQSIVSKTALQLPDKHLVDHRSFDFRRVDTLFLIPTIYGFAYSHDPDVFKLTRSRYVLVDEQGRALHHFGVYPSRYGANSSHLLNSSVAAYRNGMIYYYFHGENDWHSYNMHESSAPSPPPALLTSLPLAYCDSMSIWYERYDPHVYGNLLNNCLNPYYLRYSIGLESELTDFRTVENGKFHYRVELLNRRERKKYVYLDREARLHWVENAANAMVFFALDKGRNVVEIFE
jgi:hypothetical protein